MRAAKEHCENEENLLLYISVLMVPTGRTREIALLLWDGSQDPTQQDPSSRRASSTKTRSSRRERSAEHVRHWSASLLVEPTLEVIAELRKSTS